MCKVGNTAYFWGDSGKALPNEIEDSEILRLKTIIGYGGKALRNDNELINILKENKNVLISFKFDWQSYKSWILVVGKEKNNKMEIETPQIPLLGGCWSDSVATRCITGQIFLSAMMECVKIQVEYIARHLRLDVCVYNNDKCFYAPFMYYNKGSSFTVEHTDGEYEKEYHPILNERYPEAYQFVSNLNNNENFWEKFFDDES